MATYFYSINAGQNEYEATAQSLSASKDVEIAVNSSTNVPTREDLLLAVEKLKNFILRQPYAPF